MPRTLTATQGAILHAIKALTQEKGHAPSQREIGARAGLSSPSATVARHLRQLASYGLVSHQPGVPRSIRLIEAAAGATPEVLPDLAALTRTARDGEQRARRAEEALTTARAKERRAQVRADRYHAQVRAVRALHTPVREHPRALLDPHAPDTACIECGRDVFTDLRRHTFDTATETWRCTARASRSPQGCPTCRDERGRRVVAILGHPRG